MAKVIFAVGIGAIIAAPFALSAMGLGWQRVAAPYAEETRSQTYESSRTYQHGMAVDLDELCRQRSLTADEGQKAVLADTIRLRSARFTGELPSHVQECLNEVR